MAYGLYVEGGNGVLQIDSDNPYLEGMGIKFIGVAAGTLSGVAAGDAVFFNYDPGNGNYGAIWPTQITNTITFKGSNFDGSAHSNKTVNVIHLGRQSAGTGTLTGAYGLQIKNSAGTANVFDSRAITSGFSMTGYVAALTISGAPSASNKLSTDITNTYVSVAPGRYDGASYQSGFQFSNNHTSGLGTGINFYNFFNTPYGSFSTNNLASFTIGESF